MKKIKYRRLAAMAASLLCCLIFTVPAYARATSRSRRQLPPRRKPKRSRKPRTPLPRTDGTVVDNATDEDGKEFYTITTADESVFYLVIDKQKTSENVYFLNTVTTDDLLPLAEQGKEPPKEVTPEPEPKPTEPVEEVPEPEPEKKDSPLLSLLLIGVVVLAGGGIGYYSRFTSRSMRPRIWRMITANMRTGSWRRSQRNPRTKIPRRGRKIRRNENEFYKQPF